jgi:orotidine-5'-phosphate decarboxylase
MKSLSTLVSSTPKASFSRGRKPHVSKVSTFYTKLDQAVQHSDSLLCVGLDPDHHKLPASTGQFAFNRAIIDATADLVCAYKPNAAFYEALGAPGVEALKQTCDYIQKHHPHIPIILDAKRGDIGHTNAGYAEYIFDYLGADAVTVHPYLGAESLEAFLQRKDKGIIVLCRTSNPGAGEFQDLKVNGSSIYRRVARQVATTWNSRGNCSLVVGATYPRELQEIRELVGPHMPLLVPGVGAQGGETSAIIQAGLGSRQRGLIISTSRSVIFAGSGPDFADAARAAAMALKEEINTYRTEAP